MKKLMFLLLTLSITLCAVACGSAAADEKPLSDSTVDVETSEAEPAPEQDQDENLPPPVNNGQCAFNARYTRYISDACYVDDTDIPDFMVSSAEELRECLGEVPTLSDTYTGEEFNPYELYGNEYFESKVLLLVILYEGSGSFKNKIDSVTYHGDSLDVVIENISPQFCTADIEHWTIFVELDKEYYVPIESVNFIDVETHSHMPTPLVQPLYIGNADPAGLTEPDITVIQTMEEYNDFIANSGYDFDATLPDLYSYNTATRDSFYDGFFDNTVLLAIVTPARPTTTRYRLDGNYSVVKSEASLDIIVESYEVDSGDEKTIGSWILMVRTDKNYFKDDIWSVEFVAEEKIDKEINFKATNVRAGYSDKALSPNVIAEKWELDHFYRVNKDDFAFDQYLNEAVSAYDEEFFEDKYLLIIPTKSGSGSVEYNVKSVAAKTVNGQMTNRVVVEVSSPDIVTYDMAQWFIILELDREYMPGSKYLVKDSNVTVTYETV